MDIFYPVLLSLLAGMATALGALIVFVFKPTKKFISISIGFAGGVMITIALTGLLTEAMKLSFLSAIVGFAGGSLFMLFADTLVPHMKFSIFEKGAVNKRMFKTAMLIALGIAIHNMPEGFAVSAGYNYLPAFGIFIAITLALHNIPEGIAVALPLVASKCCRRRAFMITLFSGLAEPVGALIGILLLSMAGGLVPLGLAFAAGVMTYLTVDEIMPMAQKYGHPHRIGIGFIAGCIVSMLVSTIA
ncbi:MAG: ZIP family metal transporter [Candidatus Aenigmatarchaeota archaeon]